MCVSRDITEVLELLIYELLAFSPLFWELKNDRGKEKKQHVTIELQTGITG